MKKENKRLERTFALTITDEFNKYLTQKEVYIPNSEKDDDRDRDIKNAPIYGTEYHEMVNKIEDLIIRFLDKDKEQK